VRDSDETFHFVKKISGKIVRASRQPGGWFSARKLLPMPGETQGVAEKLPKPLTGVRLRIGIRYMRPLQSRDR
jgi:hypothetical protein